MDINKLTSLIKEKALDTGFDLVAVSAVGKFPENQFYKEWLSRGYAGKMGYLEKNSAKREDITGVLPGAKSIICCAVNYNTDYPYSTELDDIDRGWISRYAWGDDYHGSVLDMLKSLNEYCREICPDSFNSKFYVDTGPVMEKVYSKYSGIGWIGKNTCLINQGAGSWLFLGEIITNMELEYDSEAPDRCGTCTRCIDACPTDAIVEPYVLDATKCISYLTIELKDSIPTELREGMENNIYGCDICQDVCPWNSKDNREASITDAPEYQPREGLVSPKLTDIAGMTPDRFREVFSKSPIKRTKRRGLIRNALIAIGNSGNTGFAADVKNALTDEEPLIRAAAVWALWKLLGDEAKQQLSLMLARETDSIVISEIEDILK